MKEFSIKHEFASFEISNFEYFSQDPRNGVNSIFSVRVVSGNFSGVGDFEYNLEEFKKFILSMKDMYDLKINRVVLKDQMYSGRNYVEFTLDLLGHLNISGDLDEPGGDQFIHFSLGADQTYLKSFIESMKWVLEL